MFHAIVIHASHLDSALLRAMVAATGLIDVIRELPAPPGAYELSRLLNTVAPAAVLIDLRSASAFECAARIRETAPGCAVIGFACPPDRLPLARQAGCGALAPLCSSPGDLAAAVRKALEDKRADVHEGLFSFLPAKAGCGASIVVLNTAAALARLDKRILVIDADLRSGIQGVMLGAPRHGGLQSILERCEQLDSFLWADRVFQAHGVDFLLSSRSLDASLPGWWNYYQLLNFASDRYDAILVDLPELVNPATVEVVRRSRTIFSVCPPELPALDLAAQRHEELRRVGVPAARTSVLLNRHHRGDLPPAQIASLLDQEIAKVFPNDYPLVQAAISAAIPVPGGSVLGRAFHEFAAQLVHQAVLCPPTVKSRIKGIFGLATA